MLTARWRTILFDLDGTVVNTIPLILSSYQHALRKVLGIAPDPEESRAWIGQTLRDTFAAVHPERAADLEAAYLEYNLARIATDVLPYAGMAALLAELNQTGAHVGIVTSKRRLSATKTLEAVGLLDAVPLVGTQDDSAAHKPDPEPLLGALARLGADAAGAVYVGDAVVDLQAARAAGMDGLGVTWGAGRRDALVAEPAVAVVDTVDDLRAHLLV